MGEDRGICWFRENPVREGDSVTKGYTSELWDFTRINSTQNEFQELRDIWAQWDDEAKQLFYQNYRDLPYLLDVKVDKHLLRAMVQFWNPAYSCFTFGDVDLVPTLEEYTTLLRCPRIQGYKAYVRPASLPTFTKKLVMITGMSEQWAVARVQQKGDNVKKRVDVLALSIYDMMIFPKALGHIDEVVADLFDRLGKQNTPMPAILAETIRSLSACQRAGEGSHFWKLDKVHFRVFFEGYSSLKEAVDIPRRDDISEESFDWVPLPGIWGVVGYTPLLVLRKYRGLAQSDFSYKRDHYKKRMREISEAWKKPFCMKILTEGSMSTFEYKGWFSRRVNDNVPRPILGVARSLEESLRVIPSELEVMKQEFERKNSELEKSLEKLEEEKMCLSLDVDVQKMEVEKVKKEKRKIEEDRDDLQTHYKKAQVTLKKVELGRSLKQWQQEIHEERAKAEYWEKKFQEIRNSTAELKASLNKIEEMKHNSGGLEAALQDCELRIEQLEALIQIREVAEHLQDLAIQARALSIMYESSSDRGRELALLLDRVKTLGLRAKVYL
ncbi:hypothetical protein CXB51_033541 [Gossypium anomalum]|uniref:DUF7745 domain-containing protein n=1 Tax=Gossypium anomalum TaxID=47600 RepID=A0A8J6CNL7_9ROSI|nr:hypothetical protein CXB51_033541 [Gossypium anomalum]